MRPDACGCERRPFTRIFVPAFGDLLNGVGDHTPLFHKIPADTVENLTAIQIGPASDYDSVFVYPQGSNFSGKPMLCSKESPLVGRWAKQELIVIPQRVAFDNVAPQLVLHPATVGGATRTVLPRTLTNLDLILHHATTPPPIPSARAPKFFAGDAWVDTAVADPGRFIGVVPVAGRKRVAWHLATNGGAAPFTVSFRAYILTGVPIDPETREALMPTTSGYASIPTQILAPGSLTWPTTIVSGARTRRTIHFPDHAPLAPYATAVAADQDATADHPQGVLLGLRAWVSAGGAGNDVLISWTCEVYDE